MTIIDDESNETCFHLKDLMQVSKANKQVASPEGGEPNYVRTLTVCAGGAVEMHFHSDDSRDEIYNSLKNELKRRELPKML